MVTLQGEVADGAAEVNFAYVGVIETFIKSEPAVARSSHETSGQGSQPMDAMVLDAPRTPLHLVRRPVPTPGRGQLRLAVRACAVCRTDLHVLDGELPGCTYPIVPGHEVVGVVEQLGPGSSRFALGQRLGVPWLGWTCGACRFCRSGRENLCPRARFTGCTLDGGYADCMIADERFCFAVPDGYDDAHAAPLLCAGLIGYRAYRMATERAGAEVQRLGLYGYGAAAHIIAQVAVHDGRSVFAFTRPDDAEAQRFARTLGAAWAGSSDEAPPDALDAAILFAPVGALVPAALRAVDAGGIVVCAGIHMSDIPSFPYSLLWGERVVRSVANLTRKDGEDLLAVAPRVPVRTEVTTYPLARANEALKELRDGRLSGAAVLVP